MWLLALASSPFIPSTSLVNIRDLEYMSDPEVEGVTNTWFDSTVFDGQPVLDEGVAAAGGALGVRKEYLKMLDIYQPLFSSARIGTGATFQHSGFCNICGLRASSWDALEKWLMRVAFGNPSGIGS
ncbi:uncharacterized protein GLRG_03429 [Colletotrichum graminicola M1.001]|uniref:Uncharacterized protein n=1 Tax=Colletotrichum graminicola (strain M1.001 / M2 / FGSC 10212) TaxID=645133 RepID=E3QBE6_COLGM|nr:uncharacterized protein GLRG_03429 [Colletotrichum graminicola M1.001]EFQ28285.1 hypothetical protein GLRG_03429 [Colletotrichum graminicola M1.001]